MSGSRSRRIRSTAAGTWSSEDLLRDAGAYRAAAAHAAGGSVAAPDDDAAHARKDLAVTGFIELRKRIEAEGAAALHRFHGLAASLAAPLAGAWRDAVEQGPAQATGRAGELIAALEDGRTPDLSPALFAIGAKDSEVLGMCGRLHTYPHPEGMQIVSERERANSADDVEVGERGSWRR